MKKFFLLSTNGVSIWKNLTEWYQNSLIYEILAYLEEKYFSIELGSYKNFSIGGSTGSTVRNVVLGLAIGLIVASAMIAHTKHTTGRFVRTLIRSGCTSPETAKTLLDLNYFHNPAIRRELKQKVTLGKLVRCVEEDLFLSEVSTRETTQDGSEQKQKKVYFKRKKQDFNYDFTSIHFYIPEDLRYRAEIRFEKKGSSWLLFAIVSVLTLILAALLCVFLPDLFRFTDNLITFFSP